MTIAHGSVQEKIDLPIRPQELENISFATDQPITIRTQNRLRASALLKVPDIDLDGEESWSWEKSRQRESFLGKRHNLK